ncbi:MAG TPA: cytochrome b N-terminal domain-containing protein [Candidatus Saccharimonadales bacterium]|nr:cytochrome b N-terminal domain-containing protein [Candidatus Saccharimonadales bacterium]
MDLREAGKWLDERLGWTAVAELAKHKMVPVHKHSIWYYFGGITLFLFTVQVCTGILLMLYYRPSADEAFESVQFIVTQVSFGWLIRSIHSWSANLMVGAAFVHLFSVFFLRAYKRPREITWVTGGLLLMLSLGFGFSGYLLPWNTLAYFATRVGTDIAGAVPFVGGWIRTFLRGGDMVTGATLSRFYGWHVAILPAIVTSLLGVHVYLVQRHGMSRPGGEPEGHGGRVMPFVPNFLLRDIFGWTVALACLAALAAYSPWELGVKADPFAPAPANIRPEWYFMFMFESLKKVPGGAILGLEFEQIAIMAFGFGGLLLLTVPFLDTGSKRSGRMVQGAGWVVLAYMVGMTSYGYRSFWPLVIAAGGAGLVYFAGSRGFLVLATCLSLGLLGATGDASAAAATTAAAAKAVKKKDACVACHETLGEVSPDLSAPTQHWMDDIHEEKGLGCEGCHGGDASPELFADADASMDPKKGFRGAPTRLQIADFCGKCHADAAFMKKYNPATRVDQLSEYRTSVHGQQMARGDDKVATCIDCHGLHGIRPVKNPASPAYPTNVPDTCGRCHGNESLMSGYGIDFHVVEAWRKSVHAEALLKDGDLSAPACNDCHGNHGAVPPGVKSLAFVCGSCHAREAQLFRDSWKKDLFDTIGASECVTCHSNHDVEHPTDALIGTGPGTACSQCHQPGDECDKASVRMRAAIDKLSTSLDNAKTLLDKAEQAGMEVGDPQYTLQKEGYSGLIETRALIHAFDPNRLVARADEGVKVAETAHKAGEEAMAEMAFRRKGLALSLIFIAFLLGALYLKIRDVDRSKES